MGSHGGRWESIPTLTSLHAGYTNAQSINTLAKCIQCNKHFNEEKEKNSVSEAVLSSAPGELGSRGKWPARGRLRNRTQCPVRDPSSVPGSFPNNLGHSSGGSRLLGPTSGWMDSHSLTSFLWDASRLWLTSLVKPGLGKAAFRWAVQCVMLGHVRASYGMIMESGAHWVPGG